MNNHNNPAEGSTPARPYPAIGVIQLLTRQLADWQELLSELEQQPGVPLEQVAYCQKQVKRLEVELAYVSPS